MFSHVMFGVNDLEVSRQFYDAVLGTLGIAPGVANHNGVCNRYFYRSPTGSFGITTPLNGEPATHGNGSTVGFVMASPEQANAFHAAGVANGGTTCEDPPGWRDGAVGKPLPGLPARPRRQQNLCPAQATQAHYLIALTPRLRVPCC
jgi:catechol 2,3-dioxygenase-like lactoylglutathione lyase family enzyme